MAMMASGPPGELRDDDLILDDDLIDADDGMRGCFFGVLCCDFHLFETTSKEKRFLLSSDKGAKC